MKKNLFTQVLLSGRLLKTSRKLICTALCLLIIQAFAVAQSANILVSPATSNIAVGESFTVNVRIDMQSGSCNAAEIHLNFNTAFLRITNITRPSGATFSSETISLPSAPYTTVNSTGHLEYAAGIPSGSTSVDFDILAITFTTPVSSPQTGTTSISFQNSPGHRTRTALNGTPLTGTLTSGTVNITNCTTPPSATISAASGATTCNGQPVPLTLSSASGTSPYSLVVNGITYNGATVGGVFATVPFPSYNIWPSNPTPAVPNNNDGQSVEVGLKFRSSQTGFIKGIRFYNGNNNSGTYTGKLWNYGTGTLMASAVFSSVTTNGWQQVMFATPVQIAPNTTYLASYFSTAGNYAVTDNYLTSAVTNGTLTALADNGVSGVNGVYRYGAGMPNLAFAASNYWVDVIFTPNTNTFNLTSVTDATGCSTTGSPLQTVNVLSVDCSTLPVTLLSLSASPGTRKVTLRWATSSEINNRGFDVQRSDDGVNWTTIGFVAGAVNSNFTVNYTYTDNNLEPRKYFYRLKQIDIDDRYKYSAIVAATLNGKAEFVLGQNYPNPTSGQATIQFTLPRAEKVNLSLFDVSGRLMKVLVNGSKEAGTHAINFNAGLLSKGVYYYKIQAGDFSDVKKLTIQ